MSLKRKITKEEYEKLSKDIQAEYSLKGDTATLDVDGPDDDDLEAIRNAKEHEKTARKEAEKELRDLRKQIEQDKSKKELESGDVNKVKETLEKEHGEKVKAFEDRISALRKRTEDSLMNGAADSLSSKIFDTNAVVGRPHIEKRLKIEWDDEKDECKLVYLDSKGKPTTADKLSEEFLTDKSFAGIVKGTKASGAGPGPNGGPVGPGGSFNPNSPKGPPSRADFVARAKAERGN